MKQGKKPAYFSGGTEIITLGRSHQHFTDAIIDIKAIPECLIAEIKDDDIYFGAALSLTKVIETSYFPLLNQVLAEIADQTARNKITLGGNICGNIPYREAVLPFLITNSRAVIASLDGVKEVPLQTIFQKQLQLKNEEMLIAMKVSKKDTTLPFVAMKRRRIWDVGYPLITAAAVAYPKQFNIAFSGLCNFPFSITQSDASLSAKEKIKMIVDAIPKRPLHDVHGSAEYRQFVLENILEEVFETLEGVK